MKIPANYSATIQKLKEEGLIDETYKYAFCAFYQGLRFSDILFALGGMTTHRWSNVDYLVASDGNILKIFNIHKKTGQYLNGHSSLTKEQINKLVCKKSLFGRFKIKIYAKCINLKLDLLAVRVFKKFEQTDNRYSLVEVLKTNFVGKVGKNSFR